MRRAMARNKVSRIITDMATGKYDYERTEFCFKLDMIDCAVLKGRDNSPELILVINGVTQTYQGAAVPKMYDNIVERLTAYYNE